MQSGGPPWLSGSFFKSSSISVYLSGKNTNGLQRFQKPNSLHRKTNSKVCTFEQISQLWPKHQGPKCRTQLVSCRKPIKPLTKTEEIGFTMEVGERMRMITWRRGWSCERGRSRRAQSAVGLRGLSEGNLVGDGAGSVVGFDRRHQQWKWHHFWCALHLLLLLFEFQLLVRNEASPFLCNWASGQKATIRLWVGIRSQRKITHEDIIRNLLFF